MKDGFEGDTRSRHPSSVKVYDYYNPGNSCYLNVICLDCLTKIKHESNNSERKHKTITVNHFVNDNDQQKYVKHKSLIDS